MIDQDVLLILKSSTLTDGEPDLGETMMEKYLEMFLESGNLPARIVCMGTAVFLTTGGSRLGRLLKKFEKEGTTVLSCCTCLEYYGRMEKLTVGIPTNMKETVTALQSFKKIISI